VRRKIRAVGGLVGLVTLLTLPPIIQGSYQETKESPELAAHPELRVDPSLVNRLKQRRCGKEYTLSTKHNQRDYQLTYTPDPEERFSVTITIHPSEKEPEYNHGSRVIVYEDQGGLLGFISPYYSSSYAPLYSSDGSLIFPEVTNEEAIREIKGTYGLIDTVFPQKYSCLNLENRPSQSPWNLNTFLILK